MSHSADLEQIAGLSLVLSFANRYYRANEVHINEEALQQLPEIGDLSNLTSLPTSDPQSESSQGDLYGAHLSTSFVPNAAHY